MNKPVILITTGRRMPQAAATETTSLSVGCNIQYVEAVVRAGALPLLVPPLGSPDDAVALLARAGGLLLTGGGDVAPRGFGEKPHPSTGGVDAERDAIEVALVSAAYAKHVPVLGICRGIQIMNTALGGSLMQDIPSMVPGALHHPFSDHAVQIVSDSLVAGLLAAESALVNSRHHQAVGRLAQGLRVTARTSDGVIEALEADDGRPFLGVQWHPEDMTSWSPSGDVVFEWLVKEAGTRQA